MSKEYLNRNDIAMRLEGTFVFYKKVPYYVTLPENNIEDNAGAWKYINLSPVQNPRGKKIKVDHTDPLLDTSAPTLGFMNWDSKAYYAYRKPVRKQWQGLNSRAMGFAPMAPEGQWWFSEAFEHMLLNKYPTVQEAIRQVEDLEVKSAAFDRRLAVEKNRGSVSLLWASVPDVRTIGYWNAKEGRFNLTPGKDTSFIQLHMNSLGV